MSISHNTRNQIHFTIVYSKLIKEVERYTQVTIILKSR